MDLEELMRGAVELPDLYNAVFSGGNAAASSRPPASPLAIMASERFNKLELLSLHDADAAKFLLWLEVAGQREGHDSKPSSNAKGLQLRLRESVVETPDRPPAPLGSLRPIALSDLTLDRQDFGRVLHGTLCAKAFKLTAVFTVLEEPRTGLAVKVAIYNSVSSTAALEEVDALYPEGSRVAIKEPYLKRYVDRTVGLRVNNPGDVVLLDPVQESSDQTDQQRASKSPAGNADKPEQKMTYEELRAAGNRAFSAGNWKAAVQDYTRCIRLASNSAKLKSCDTSLSSSNGGASSSSGTQIQGETSQNLIVTKESACSCAPTKAQSRKSSKRLGRRRGNATSNYSKQHQAQQQERACSVNLPKAESNLLAAYSNRSEAYHRLQNYSEALADAESALKIDSTHVKSVFRKGRALHFLQLYSEAVQCLQGALVLAPNDADIMKALKESLAGDLQSRLGIYDLSSYYTSDMSGPPPHCADFIGPVKVTMLESKYGGRGSGQRGVVVTKAVKAGDLLMVSNPLAVARVDEDNIEFHVNPDTRRMNDVSQEDLVTQLYNLARKSPRALHQLDSLYDGGWCKSTEPSVQLFIRGVLGDSEFSSDDHGKQPDITKIRNIVQWNAFDERGYSAKSGGQGLRKLCSGIWVFPSFINHSCLPNASRVHVGNAMMVHAARDLEEGDEVLLPYFDILAPLRKRREWSENGWGFICKCPRCMLEEGFQRNKALLVLTGRFSQIEEAALPVAAAIDDRTTLAASVGSAGGGFVQCARQFLALSCEVEVLLTSTSPFARLTEEKKKWLRASFAIAYIVGSSSISSNAPSYDPRYENSQWKALVVNATLESLLEVFPGSSQTVGVAATLVDEMKRKHGMKSQVFKRADETAMFTCRCVFGNQKGPVLRSLIKAVQEGMMQL